MLYIMRLPLIRHLVTDKLFIQCSYKWKMRKKLNLENPKSFNEKIQWLKLYDRNPIYTNLVDKYEVRKYIAKEIGEEYLIPLIGVWDKFDEIDFTKLPQQFVLKCTHDSGGIVICKNKDNFDIKAAKKKLNKSLKRNYYYYSREWQYKNVKPRIICEKYMVDETGTGLKDYKIFCFSGIPKIIQVDYNRFIDHKRNIYDVEWNYIPASIQYPTDSNIEIKKPKNLETMLKLAKVLSRNHPHIRIDLYSVSEKIYFGEITFHHGSGYEKFEPESLEMQMGEWIVLPHNKI